MMEVRRTQGAEGASRVLFAVSVLAALTGLAPQVHAQVQAPETAPPSAASQVPPEVTPDPATSSQELQAPQVPEGQAPGNSQLGKSTPETQAPRTFHYVVGALVESSPDYAGGDGRAYRLRPAWALEWGRFRLSTSRGSSMMGHGLERRDSGASATLLQGVGFHVGASLRIDNGRDEGDSSRLAGLPPVRSTLRGKVGAGYALTDRWSLNAGLSQDLLGRQGGAQASAGVGYTWPLTPSTKMTWGVSTGWGNGTYMRSHFGVPAGAPNGWVPYEPRAGLYSADTGLEFMTALSRHWVVLGGVRVSQLLGDARRSPVTVNPTGYSASIGLAYRCCR